MSNIVGWKFTGLLVSWSPSPVRLCRSCLWRFGNLRKKHTTGVWEYIFYGFCNFLTISGAHKPFAAVSQLPVALRLPQNKHASGFGEHVSCGFSQSSSILCPPSGTSTE